MLEARLREDLGGVVASATPLRQRKSRVSAGWYFPATASTKRATSRDCRCGARR
jgi:hypothetical protein